MPDEPELSADDVRRLAQAAARAAGSGDTPVTPEAVVARHAPDQRLSADDVQEARSGPPDRTAPPDQRLSADPVRLRCSHHDIELVCIDRQPPRLWTCPIAALHDLCDRFEQVYEANYGPAPAGENGVYHHARRVVEAAHSAQGES